MKTLLAVGGALLLGACAHSAGVNEVAMKVSDRQAHVLMKAGELAVGERVVLFNETCVPTAEDYTVEYECETEVLGEGVVAELLGDDYSKVLIDEGVQFTEGAQVQSKANFQAGQQDG